MKTNRIRAHIYITRRDGVWRVALFEVSST